MKLTITGKFRRSKRPLYESTVDSPITQDFQLHMDGSKVESMNVQVNREIMGCIKQAANIYDGRPDPAGELINDMRFYIHSII